LLRRGKPLYLLILLAGITKYKVCKIKSVITLALANQQFDPLSSDQPTSGEPMSEFTLVTETEVAQLLKSMPSKSSPQRSTFVRWKQHSSGTYPLDAGVPQVSALGPFLFSLYIAPLSGVIGSLGVRHHQYADDTQIYITVSRADLSINVGQLENCTAEVHAWLQTNGLQLNPKKSEVIQFTTPRGHDRVEDITAIRV
jgi:hypothetical protein